MCFWEVQNQVFTHCFCYFDVDATGRSSLPGLSTGATAAFTALLCVLDGLQWTSCGCGAAVSSAPIRAQHWPTQRPAQYWAVAMWAADECKQEGKQRMFGRERGRLAGTWWSAEIVQASENKLQAVSILRHLLWTDEGAWNELFPPDSNIIWFVCGKHGRLLFYLYTYIENAAHLSVFCSNHGGRADNTPSFLLLSRPQQGAKTDDLFSKHLSVTCLESSKWNNSDSGSLLRSCSRRTTRDPQSSSKCQISFLTFLLSFPGR